MSKKKKKNDEVKVKVKQEAKPTTLMICTPMYNGMCSGLYVQGLLGTANRMRELGVQVYWAQIMNESLITRARNELVRLFIEHGDDYLMFIDADICFDEHAVAQLLACDKDIVCGIYPKKEVDWDAVAKAAKEGKDALADFGGTFVFNMAGGEDARTDETGAIEVRHGGTGFMLVRRRVFERLIFAVPTYRISSLQSPDNTYLKPLTHEFFATSISDDGVLLSEDYTFCELWRKHGGKIYAQPFIKLSHVGTYIYGGDLIKAGGNLK